MAPIPTGVAFFVSVSPGGRRRRNDLSVVVTVVTSPLSVLSAIRPPAASTLTTVPVNRARTGAAGVWALAPAQISVAKTMITRDFITLINTWKVPKLRGVAVATKVTRAGVALIHPRAARRGRARPARRSTIHSSLSSQGLPRKQQPAVVSKPRKVAAHAQILPANRSSRLRQPEALGVCKYTRKARTPGTCFVTSTRPTGIPRVAGLLNRPAQSAHAGINRDESQPHQPQRPRSGSRRRRDRTPALHVADIGGGGDRII